MTSELSVYSGGAVPTIQFNERIRWLAFEPPRDSIFAQRGLYIAEKDRDLSTELSTRFVVVKRIAEVARTRSGRPIAQYVIYLIEKPTSAILNLAG